MVCHTDGFPHRNFRKATKFNFCRESNYAQLFCRVIFQNFGSSSEHPQTKTYRQDGATHTRTIYIGFQYIYMTLASQPGYCRVRTVLGEPGRLGARGRDVWILACRSSLEDNFSLACGLLHVWHTHTHLSKFDSSFKLLKCFVRSNVSRTRAAAVSWARC